MSKLKSTGYLSHSVQKISGRLHGHNSKVLRLSLRLFCGGKLRPFHLGSWNWGKLASSSVCSPQQMSSSQGSVLLPSSAAGRSVSRFQPLTVRLGARRISSLVRAAATRGPLKGLPGFRSSSVRSFCLSFEY